MSFSLEENTRNPSPKSGEFPTGPVNKRELFALGEIQFRHTPVWLGVPLLPLAKRSNNGLPHAPPRLSGAATSGRYGRIRQFRLAFCRIVREQ